MKTSCLLFFSAFLIQFNSLFAQQDELNYQIISTGNKYSTEEISESIEAANMCGFFYFHAKRELIFDDGSIVYLDSMEDSNNLDQSCCINKSSTHDDEVWRISESGHLILVKETYGK